MDTRIHAALTQGTNPIVDATETIDALRTALLAAGDEPRRQHRAHTGLGDRDGVGAEEAPNLGRT